MHYAKMVLYQTLKSGQIVALQPSPKAGKWCFALKKYNKSFQLNTAFSFMSIAPERAYALCTI